MTLEEAKQKPDQDWYRELFKKHELKRLSNEEVASIITASMGTATDFWERYQTRYQSEGPQALLESMGVKVYEQIVQEPTNLLAYYDVDQNTLQLQIASINAFHSRVVDAGYAHLLTLEDCRRMVLTHELFHVLEMNEPDAYTYGKIMPKRFLFFRWSSRLKTAGEVGAYHFTKLAMPFDFPPQFLEEL